MSSAYKLVTSDRAGQVIYVKYDQGGAHDKTDTRGLTINKNINNLYFSSNSHEIIVNN